MQPHPVPKVGDTVVFNDNGLEQVFNSRHRGLAHMKTLRMTITWVDSESMTSPEPTYPVEVDNAEINSFLIDHHCFDIVERA
jgi:signal peptidase I